jgi:hypothetical protein
MTNKIGPVLDEAGIKSKPPLYRLLIYLLEKPYKDQNQVEDLHLDLEFKSQEPFGSFNVGDTLTDGMGLKYLGEIQHIHHWIGSCDGEWRHDTKLYLFSNGDKA